MAKARTSKRKSSPSAAKSSAEKQLVSVFDDPPRKNVLLLTCMDQRLLDDTVVFMNELNLENRYDQVAVAGSAMGVNRLPKDPPHPSAYWWELFTTHLFAAINVLHRPIHDVFLVDHLDCGAYKHLHADDGIAASYRDASLDEMRAIHAKELTLVADRLRTYCDDQIAAAQVEFEAAEAACNEHCREEGQEESECWAQVKKLAEEKRDAWKDIRISKFIMDVRGDVKQLDVPAGQRSTLKE